MEQPLCARQWQAHGLPQIPWATVTHMDLETASPVLSGVTYALAQLDDLWQRRVLLCPYTSSADEALHALASGRGRHQARQENSCSGAAQTAPVCAAGPHWYSRYFIS